MNSSQKLLEHILCPVCGADKIKVKFPKTATGQVVECFKCHFLFVPNPPKEAVISSSSDIMTDEDIVNKEYYLDALAGKQKDARIRLRDLESVAGKRKNLLDVGSYIGIFLAQARKAGWEATGLEPIRKAAEWGRENFGIKILSATLREAKLLSNHFDAVTFFEVIEHLQNPRAELSEAMRVLRPGGYLVIETPNAASWLARLFGSRWRQWIPGHVSLFSPKNLSLLCAGFGFEIVKIKKGKRKAVSLGLLAVVIRDRISRPAGSVLLALFRCLHLKNLVITFWLPDVFTLYVRK